MYVHLTNILYFKNTILVKALLYLEGKDTKQIVSLQT